MTKTKIDDNEGATVSTGSITPYTKLMNKPLKRRVKDSVELNDIVRVDKKKYKKIKEAITSEEVYGLLQNDLVLPIVVECDGIYAVIELEDKQNG